MLAILLLLSLKDLPHGSRHVVVDLIHGFVMMKESIKMYLLICYVEKNKTMTYGRHCSRITDFW
jgi:hypothetical protein